MKLPASYKKITVALLSVVLLIANKKYQLGIDQDTLNSIVSIVIALLVGIGMADFGKSSQQIKSGQMMKNDS